MRMIAVVSRKGGEKKGSDKNGSSSIPWRAADKASEEYKENLANWVIGWRKQLGDDFREASYQQVATHFQEMLSRHDPDSKGISVAQLQKWATKGIEEELTETTLGRIAALRGETADQTKAYLRRGEKIEPKDRPSLAALMHQRPLDEVAAAIAVGIERLRQWQQFQKFDVAIPQENVPRLISLLYSEQARQNLLGNDKKFADYLGVGVDQLNLIRAGRFPWNQDGESEGLEIVTISKLAGKVADEHGNYGNWRLFAQLIGFDPGEAKSLD